MKDVVGFGTGKVGQGTLPFIEEKYHVMFWIDNNKDKWGSTFGEYIVKSPEAIKQWNGDIVITSTKYGMEIADQLEQKGIDKSRLLFCRRYLQDRIEQYEIYPMLEENISKLKLPLVQYDLLHQHEQETKRKKVMIFCSFYSTYTKQLIENMSVRSSNIEFSLLTNAKESRELILSDKLKHIYYFQTMADLKSILEQLPLYDVMQLLWIEHEWAYFHKLIRKKAKRLNLNVGGSDFYRTVEREREFRRTLIDSADKITAETQRTVDEFGEYFNCQEKMGLLPFGIEVLDYINQNDNGDREVVKKNYNIPLNKIVVTCGHNAGAAHQHLKMIDALNKLPHNIKQRIICVFPMTYPQGQDAYINNIKDALNRTDLEYVILTDFMDLKGMAQYALISDVMIHVQTTDQLSSTMLEEMYAGGIVVAGSWLPYQSLHEMGIYFLDVDAISDVTEVIEEVVINIDDYKKKCVGNRAIVWKHSSWEELAPGWCVLWD